MKRDSEVRRGPALLAGWLLLVAGVTFLFALRLERMAHPWIMGEWLINDRGGFVRRGLMGEVLLRASALLRLPVLPLLSAVQLGLYALWYGSVFVLGRGIRRWSWPLVAAVVSPATLAFTVLDPPSSVRKEVLLFLALAALCLWCRRAGVQWRWGWMGLVVAAPVLVLVHEALLAYLPYLWVPLLAGRPRAELWRRAWLPLPLVVLALVAVVRHPGDAAQVKAMCAALAGPGTGLRPELVRSTDSGALCGGAIAYLGHDARYARAETARAVERYGYGSRYAIPALLSLLPFALVARRRGDGRGELWVTGTGELRAARVLGVAGVAAVVLSVPLFFVARDWGRWIHIHATCLMVLALFYGRAGGKVEEERRWGVLPWGALLLYATCWTLPAVGIYPGRFGYVDVVRYLRAYRSSPHLTALAFQAGAGVRSG